MQYSFLFFDYIKWHYAQAIVSIWRIVGNLAWFFYHMFSVPLLIRTLWTPWHKLSDVAERSFRLGDMLENALVSFLMRLVGICARLITITVGLVFICGMYVVGVIFTLFWLMAPFLAVLSILVGLRIII